MNTALAANSRIHVARKAGMLTYSQTKRRKEACIVDGDEGWAVKSRKLAGGTSCVVTHEVEAWHSGWLWIIWSIKMSVFHLHYTCSYFSPEGITQPPEAQYICVLYIVFILTHTYTCQPIPSLFCEWMSEAEVEGIFQLTDLLLERDKLYYSLMGYSILHILFTCTTHTFLNIHAHTHLCMLIWRAVIGNYRELPEWWICCNTSCWASSASLSLGCGHTVNESVPNLTFCPYVICEQDKSDPGHFCMWS